MREPRQKQSMPDPSSLTPDQIRTMSYNELVALVRETNRFPGGRRSIHRIASRLMLTSSSRVLEIGCATGSTAIELKRLVGCDIYAVDINPVAIAEAQRRADVENLAIDFATADAADIPKPDQSFDIIICGNVTALIDDKAKAVAEYDRVLKSGGVIVAAPMYYLEPPSTQLIADVRAAVQVDLPIAYREEALDFYFQLGFETYDVIDYAFDEVSQEHVDSVVSGLLASPHLDALQPASAEALRNVYANYMHLFRRNLALMGFSILFLRKTHFVEDEELFTAHEVAKAGLNP